MTSTGPARTILRVTIGAALVFTGVSHLFWARESFQAQVPAWVPLDPDFVVVASGVVEIVLGIALIALPRYRVLIGWLVAGFFVAVFPGNISQFVMGIDSFGLNDDVSRFVRLLFQPVLVLITLWGTGAWRDRRTLLPLPPHSNHKSGLT
jgi:uncharacterized membrane protein